MILILKISFGSAIGCVWLRLYYPCSRRATRPSTIYAKVVAVCTIEFIKVQIVCSTLIDTAWNAWNECNDVAVNSKQSWINEIEE